MKYVKLLAIFIVLAAGIYFALNWDSIFPSSNPTEDFADENLIDITEKCDEIRTAWEAESGWNENLYTHQREDIDQSKNMGMFSFEGYATVNRCLIETVTSKTCDCYLQALHASPFAADVLKQQYDGVLFIKKAEKLDKDSRISKVEQLHQLYNNITNFIHSPHSITPRFNGVSGNWESFGSAQQRILSTAASYRNNPLFKELEQIPGFKDGLSESTLRSATNSQRESFYKGLSRQIIAYFSQQDPTDEQKNQLKEVFNRFSDEGINYISDLASFTVRYGK